MSTRGEQRALILWGIGMALGAIVTLWTLYLIRNVLLVVYIGSLLAIGMSPAVRWLEQRHIIGRHGGGLPRWASILALYLAFLVAVGGLLLLVVPPLVTQTQQLVVALLAPLRSIAKVDVFASDTFDVLKAHVLDL